MFIVYNQIIGTGDRIPDHIKWCTSTRLAFGNVTSEDRRDAYHSVRGDLQATKELQTRDVGILRDNCHVPAFSKYKQDFRPTSNMNCLDVHEYNRLVNRTPKMPLKTKYDLTNC